ncbi:uncharacterized protein [Montipora foliosa]|uniref:uncharacterized protein n=1 Tax=Montipora foliosa TaxID=591990 RepID=UPI0035F19BFE
MNQKKRVEVEPDTKRAKKMSGKQKQGNTCQPPQRKKQLEKGTESKNEPKRKKQLDKGTKEDDYDKNRKEQEREAKRRKKEEEKKKRDAKQQQRKEQLVMLQRQHPNFSIVEEASDSDDEYQPTVLDESTGSESEGEEQLSVAKKHPSKGCAPLQQSFAQLTRSPAASSGIPNPGCTPLNTSTKPGHKRSSTVVNAQPRQLPSTSLGNSSSLNVNPRPRPTSLTNLLAFVNPRQTPPNSAGPHHTETHSSNSGHKSFPVHPHHSASSLSSPGVLSAPVFPCETPSPPASPDNLSSSDMTRHRPSPPASPDRTLLSIDLRHTPSPAARHNCVSSSVNTLYTPSPPGNSARTPPGHLAPVLSSAAHHVQTPSIIAENVDWQEEYRQLHVKYNALKEKVKMLEQSSQGEYSNEERPPPGIYNSSDAQKYKMVEVCPGTRVFWYLGNKTSALNNTKTAGELTTYLMDTFFSKGYQQLNPTIVNALRGFVLDDNNYGKEAGIIFNKTVQDKCCGARRGVSKGITL